MASYIPAVIKNRLLRYGLSKLGLLDTDEWELDKLAIALGKKSTVELKDVGLRVNKLVSLLHLPEQFVLDKARIRLLRITVPTDILNTGILVEIDGVDVLLKVTRDVPARSGSKQGAARASGANREGEEGHLPTTDELAKSYVKDQPADERRILEDVIISHPEAMEASIASSEDEDEEVTTGTGTGLSAPAFLANFLQGVADRLRVMVNNVDMQVEMEVPTDNRSIFGLDPEGGVVTLNLRVEDFHIEGVTIDAPATEDPAIMQPPSRKGKRLISLENIYARLMSEQSLLPRQKRRSTSESASEGLLSSPLSRSRPDFEQLSSSDRSGCTTQDSSHSSLQASNQPDTFSSGNHISRRRLDSRTSNMEDSMVTDDGDRFADAGESESDHASSSLSGQSPSASRTSAANYDHSEPGGNDLDEAGLWDSRFLDDEDVSASAIREAMSHRLDESTATLDDSLRDLPETFPRQHISATSPNIETPSLDQEPDSIVSRSQPIPEHSFDSPSNIQDDTQSPASPGSDSPSSISDDLTESRVYSHEDARSMYLSAMTDAKSVTSEDFRVPGGWDSESISSDTQLPRLPGAFEESEILPHSYDPIDNDDGLATPRPGSRASNTSTKAGKEHISISPSEQTAAAKTTTYNEDDERVARYIFTIDRVSLWLPGEQDQEPRKFNTPGGPMEDAFRPTDSSFMADSTHQGVPGSFSFSQYAETSGPKPRQWANMETRPKPSEDTKLETSVVPGDIPRPIEEDGLDVAVGSVQIHADGPTSWLAYLLFKQLASALSRRDVEANAPEDSPTADKTISHQTSISRVTLAFADYLAAVPVHHHSFDDAQRAMESNEAGVLLKMSLQDVTSNIKDSPSLYSIDAALRKFSFGFSDQDLLHFLPSGPSKSSPRDVDTATKDVKLTYTVSNGQPRLHIDTLPLRILLDVQRLDETLGQFGGFSGVLELGSSIASNGTTTQLPKAEQPPRGVRFESAPLEPSIDKIPPLKINTRLAGISFALKGKTCSISLDASPVKIVIREQAIKLIIRDGMVYGPHLFGQVSAETLNMRLSGIEIEYLFTPQETDLTRLLSLITPSKDKYEDDDDILLDTLLRQRRKGGVVRTTVTDTLLRVPNLSSIDQFKCLGDELARLSTVTKYLPEDDRPGILTLLMIKNFESLIHVNDQVGTVDVDFQNGQVAHVGIPSLLACEMGTLSVRRGEEELIGEVLPQPETNHLPMIMARMIGDEIVPTLKVKIFNLLIEYSVSTYMAFAGLDETSVEGVAVNMAESVATIMGNQSPTALTRQSSNSSDISAPAKKLRIDVQLRDCALGLNPEGKPSKALFVLSDTHFSGAIPGKDDVAATVEIRKAFLLVIDDADRFTGPDSASSRHSALGSRQVVDLCRGGFVSLSEIKAAKAEVAVKELPDEDFQSVEVNFKDDLIVFEACADSLQTLIGIMNGLAPPMPPRRGDKFRTNMSLQNMMDSFTGNAYTIPEDAVHVDQEPDPMGLSMDEADTIEDELPTNMEFVGSIYNSESMPSPEETADSMLEGDLSGLASPPVTRTMGQKRLLESFQEQYEVREDPEPLDFGEDYFGTESQVKEKPAQWNSSKNEYDMMTDFPITKCPFKLKVRDVHFIFNMFDGYDWAKTRDEVTNAVDRLEKQAEERRMKNRAAEEPDDAVIGDHLFNSIWIEVRPDAQPNELRRQVKMDLDDLISESESYATTTVSRTPTALTTKPSRKPKKLRFGRSKHHKMTIELAGVSADVFVFPPGSGETQSSVDVRVNDLEIFDHVPSSTWKKFATYMHDAGEREMGKPMVRLELLTVKPVQDLMASELVLKVTVLPLRLHVDQDALDFMTRFFEFSDEPKSEHKESSIEPPPSEPFLQRLEVNTVVLKLDYKPKKVDYRGLRSGHTTEFMNFVILDGADIVLRHAILYGIAGFDRLHKTLNDVWMPDVKRNQLPGILAGLAPVRPLVNVGAGVRDLVVVPMREYRKDGRVVRAIQKGAFAFATKTTSELARLGAKMAIGTHTVLQGAENLLAPSDSSSPSMSSPHGTFSPTDPDAAEWDTDFDGEPQERRAHSNYADQPLSFMTGISGAARGLERDLLTARDAIVAVGGGVRGSDNPGDAMRAVTRGAPTIILRPAIGATKALGTALLGAGNQLDPKSERRISDKYKRH